MVTVIPAELTFKRPFTHEVSQVLRLRNESDNHVAFKVKTTAPKQYCVRPNSGRIAPDGEVEVQVLLQAMKEDPPLDARCRDKFLVQSAAFSPEEHPGGVAQLWAQMEQTDKHLIDEKKIRVSFLPAEGAAPATNGVSHHENEPPAYSSPSPASGTPQRATDTAPADTKSPGSPSSYHVPSRSALESTTAAVAQSVGMSESELRRQLDEAKATISRLQTQAAEQTGLRQRKSGSESASGAKTGPATLHSGPPAGGVPVRTVAVLCLLCFLIAYLFF